MSTNFYVERSGDRVHLGKRSTDWPFLYHAQPGWTAENAYEQWCALLNTGRIVDEYGQEWTAAQMAYEAAEWDRNVKRHELFAGQFFDVGGRRFDPAEFC